MKVSERSPESVVKWFDEKYYDKLGHRAGTMKMALQMLRASGGRMIVETGSLRADGNWMGDGQSTLVWCDYGLKFKAAVVTIDNDPKAIKTVNEVVSRNFEFTGHFLAMCDDGAYALKGINAPIGMLYLDSLDYDPQNPEPAQRQALAEFEAAEPWTHTETVLLIDDCALPGGGKGGLVVDVARRHGWRMVREDYQVLMQKE